MGCLSLTYSGLGRRHFVPTQTLAYTAGYFSIPAGPSGPGFDEAGIALMREHFPPPKGWYLGYSTPELALGFRVLSVAFAMGLAPSRGSSRPGPASRPAPHDGG